MTYNELLTTFLETSEKGGWFCPSREKITLDKFAEWLDDNPDADLAGAGAERARLRNALIEMRDADTYTLRNDILNRYIVDVFGHDSGEALNE